MVTNKNTHNYSIIHKIQRPLHKYMSVCLHLYIHTHIHYNKQKNQKKYPKYLKTFFFSSSDNGMTGGFGFFSLIDT